MLRFLREGARHRPAGAWGVLIQAGSVAAALYVLWIGALATITGTWALQLADHVRQFEGLYHFLVAFGTWARRFTAYFHLDISIFIAITFPIAFLTTTASPWRKRLNWLDVALAAASLAVALYYIVLNDRFLHWSRGFTQPTTWDLVVGLALVALVVELCRRSTSWGLTSLLVVLLAFTVFGRWIPGPLRHDNFSLGYFIEMMTIQENGIFGAPLEVAATYAFLFVLFGNFYNKAGGGQLFFDLASAITGRMRGGAAKACVTASGLYGSVSGSPTADVATTGPLTIPIMKKMGIPAARAGAIEATASSGGAMLPPVMGAVAFIMSDLTGIAYASICWASLLPALIYYYSIYLLVHNEAVRNNEPRMPEESIVPLGRALAGGWGHLLPLGALIGLLVAGYTPVYVAAGATAAVIVLSWFHPPTAIGPRRFVECCTDTITQLVPLVGAVAAAGVVIGAIEISALAGKFTLLINTISGGLLIPTLLLSALFLVLLGMGMPTPAVYIMGAALLAPVLRGVFNLPEMQVHLFMLYFACLSAITPPVAVANFAAGAIAGVNPMALGPYAVKLAIGGFILPFYFLFNPGLNMEGGVLYILECLVFAVAMCTFASFALQGY
ncbi:MAG TPA: TRAP transporter fused permease subunit, partial [Candidatus Limnocylindrales bacterium]|nr:TRAP transporter fused permease subunit [Candidatus Limnocylindrales bacterium]